MFNFVANRKFRNPPILSLRLVRKEGEEGRIQKEPGVFEKRDTTTCASQIPAAGGLLLRTSKSI
jgi:hypothetical protein